MIFKGWKIVVAQMVQNSIFKFRVIFIVSQFFSFSDIFIFREIFVLRDFFIFSKIFTFSEIFIFTDFIFRDIFIFSEISVCTEFFLKNSCFKNVKNLLSRKAMLESFWGTLTGLSENLFAPASGKRNSTVDAISGVFQSFQNLQRWRL